MSAHTQSSHPPGSATEAGAAYGLPADVDDLQPQNSPLDPERTTHGRMSRVRRRTVLKGAGAALALITLGGVWRAESRGVFDPTGGEAFAPWIDWQHHEHGAMTALVSAAILASNAHNAQPWAFRIHERRIDVFEDAERHLGALDPFDREMHIGLGCAIENLLLAARANGYEPELSFDPSPADPSHVVTVDLAPGPVRTTALYEAIPHRHTNRHPFDTSQELSRESVEELGALNDEADVRAHWFTSTSDCGRVHELLADAAQAITDDPDQSYDNGPRWLRQGPHAIEHHRDGLTLDTMGLADPALFAAKMLPDPSADEANDFWLDTLDEQARTAGAFGILSVRDEGERVQRIAAGRVWQRMHLSTVSSGLAAQPMNQLHERADREAQLDLDPTCSDALAELVDDTGWRPLFTFRVGHPSRSAPRGPRRPVRQVLAGS